MAKTDHDVTTTNKPGKVKTVDDRELVDLQRMGLLATYEAGPLKDTIKLNTERQRAAAGDVIEQQVEATPSTTEKGR